MTKSWGMYSALLVILALSGCRSPAISENPENEDTVDQYQVIMEEKVISSGARSIYGKLYRPDAAGVFPLVILSHGYNSCHADLAAECQFFAQNGFIAYAYDFCGGSTRSRSSGRTVDMTLFSEKSDLLCVYDELSLLEGVDRQRIYLFGASQGGMVSAMAAAELQGNIAGMALYFPAFCIPDDWRAKYPTLDDLPDSIPFWGMDLGPEFVRSIHDFQVYDTIGSYTGKVLIISGDNDQIVKVPYVTQADATYKNCELIILPGEGHGFSPAGNQFAREKCLDFLQVPVQANLDNTYQPIPDRYQDQPAKGGQVVSFSYTTRNHQAPDDTDTDTYTKEALVYLPHGFDAADKTKKYNVLYLMHGGSDSPAWFFDGEGESSALKLVLDNLIAEGRMAPVIVCAVSYYEEYSSDATANCGNFHRELVQDLMPVFEPRFNVNPTRDHRAFGGFSMGAMTTWSVFEHCLDSFASFLPVSGDCWALGMTAGGRQPGPTARYLADKVREQGYTAADFKIYSGCGTSDIAEPNLTPQVSAMQALVDTFVLSDSFATGNLYQCVVDGGHDRGTVLKVMYNGLPKMFWRTRAN